MEMIEVESPFQRGRARLLARARPGRPLLGVALGIPADSPR